MTIISTFEDFAFQRNLSRKSFNNGLIKSGPGMNLICSDPNENVFGKFRNSFGCRMLGMRVKENGWEQGVFFLLVGACNLFWRAVSLMTSIYAYSTPHPKHRPKYTKAKVLPTQDKHTQLSS